MKSKQILIFTLLEDIVDIIRDFETVIEIKYYKSGMHDSTNIPTYNSLFEVPNIGVAMSGDTNRINSYLIAKKPEKLIIRGVPQRTGKIKYAVDQMYNPKSIELKLGGIYQEKENVIVSGRVATISDELDSLELFNLLSRKIKKEFKKIGVFYVGKAAEDKLKKGWRLVTNERSPKENDLKLI